MDGGKIGPGLIKHISEGTYCMIVLSDRTESVSVDFSHSNIFHFQFFLCSYVRLVPAFLSVSCCLCLKSIHLSVFFCH